MKEEWRKVKGYEGIYEVSNLGRVRSIDRVTVDKNGLEKKLKGRILNCTNTHGYRQVTLCKDGKVKTNRVHKMVSSAFLGDRKPQVNHKDGDKTNNNLSNLELVSCLDNLRHKNEVLYPRRRGVSWCKRYKKWQSNISINNVSYFLGYFGCKKEAYAAFYIIYKEWYGVDPWVEKDQEIRDLIMRGKSHESFARI